MHSRNPLSVKALLAGAALALAAAATQAQDITVGVVLATSGPGSAVGVPTRNAVALWPTEIAGHKLKLVIQDDRSDPAAALRGVANWRIAAGSNGSPFASAFARPSAISPSFRARKADFSM